MTAALEGLGQQIGTVRWIGVVGDLGAGWSFVRVCVPCEAEKEGLGVRYHCLVSCSDRCRWHFCEEVC